MNGRLVEAASGAPLEGAMVVLLDAGETTVGSSLTDATGRFSIRAPASGVYRLRADRIGHASTLSPTLELRTGSVLTFELAALVEPVQLAGLEVEGNRRCVIRPAHGLNTATVWEEARKALANAAWTQDRGLYQFEMLSFERDLDPLGRRVLREDRSYSEGFQRTTFVSLPAQQLMGKGFVQEDEQGRTYYAPDANVLLSDLFLDTHCLRLEEGRDDAEGLLGIAFEPLEGRRLPEIAGVLWLDLDTAELRWLDYRYRNLGFEFSTDRLGGRVDFEALPNGTWIVGEWRIRMPMIRRIRGARGDFRTDLGGIKESGGLVLRVLDIHGDLIVEAETGTLMGTVLDASQRSPVPGARVTILGTGLETEADEEGRFRIPRLGEGLYSVTFTHPDLRVLSFQAEPMEVEIEPGHVTSIRLVAPSRASVVAEACRDFRDDASGRVVAGYVTEAENGAPLRGATVTLRWSTLDLERTPNSRWVRLGESEAGVQSTTDANGAFLACGVPTDRTLRADARYRAFSAAVAPFTVSSELLVQSQHFPIPMATSSEMRGRVVDARSGDVLAGARVTLRGTELSALTNDLGRFRLDGLAEGAYLLTAEFIGYAVRGDSISVGESQIVEVEIRLPGVPMQEDEAVEVIGRRPRRSEAKGGRSQGSEF